MLILKVGKPNLTLKQYEDFHSINSFKYKFEVFEANSDIVSQFQAKNCIIKKSLLGSKQVTSGFSINKRF